MEKSPQKSSSEKSKALSYAEKIKEMAKDTEESLHVHFKDVEDTISEHLDIAESKIQDSKSSYLSEIIEDYDSSQDVENYSKASKNIDSLSRSFSKVIKDSIEYTKSKRSEVTKASEKIANCDVQIQSIKVEMKDIANEVDEMVKKKDEKALEKAFETQKQFSEQKKNLTLQQQKNTKQLEEIADKIKAMYSEAKKQTVNIATQVSQQQEQSHWCEQAKTEKLLSTLDICFMIDCTGSMSPYIKLVREKVNEITRKIRSEHPQSNVRVSIVAYRDFGDTKQFEVKQFTDNIGEIESFVENLQADGGQDGPEDVNGGFQKALNEVSWKKASRIIFHIADAPCHGNSFHDAGGDYFPDGHKSDQPWGSLFKKMKEKRINYVFMKIGDYTDKMIQKFREIHEGIKINDKQGQPVEVFFQTSDIKNTDQEQFVKDVSQIAATTITQTLGKLAKGSMRAKLAMKASKHLKTINLKTNISRLSVISEEEELMGVTTSRLHLNQYVKPHRADWESQKGWSSFFKAVSHYTEPKSIDQLCKKGNKTIIDDNILIKVDPIPFSQGTFSLAYYALLCKADSPSKQFKVILKQPKSEIPDDQFFSQMMIKNAYARYLASYYNQKLEEKGFASSERVFFSQVFVLDIGQLKYQLEPFIKGPFEKFTNNAEYVNEIVPLMTTLSHFSYWETRRKFMICDLQGVGTILTDPAMHSFKQEMGPEDHSFTGFVNFFQRHRCNNYCKGLGLPPHEMQKHPKPQINEKVTCDLVAYKKCAELYCNGNAIKKSCDTCGSH